MEKCKGLKEEKMNKMKIMLNLCFFSSTSKLCLCLVFLFEHFESMLMLSVA